MKRKLDRAYFFRAREVSEIIIAHLRAKDVPAPEYVGDTPNCTWTFDGEGVRVQWTEDDEYEVT